MSVLSARLLALAIGLLLAGLLAAVLWPERPADSGVTLVDRSEELELLRAEHGLDQLADIGSQRLPRRLLPPAVAALLFPFDNPTLVYDPLPYYRRRAFVNLVKKWPEHPRGRFRTVTNSLGLRHDAEVLRVPPDLRLIVVGDSHTDGVCDNRDSFTSIAAARLAELLPGESVEGLNAGTGGYSFYNYLGQLERLIEFAPDVFVVAVYGGNDFYENLAPWHFFQGAERPRMSPATWQRIRAVTRAWPPALPQGYMALRYFHEHPGQLPVALQAALAAMAEIADLCAREEIALVCVYLPPISDVQPGFEEEQRRRANEELELDEEATGSIDRLATQFLDQLRARGIEVLDMRPAFSAATEPMYWLADHHINLAGQRATGLALAEVVARLRR
jgi:hypothetical protein